MALQCINVGVGCQVDPLIVNYQDSLSCSEGTLIGTPSKSNGKLNVFLHGTHVPPEGYSLLLQLSVDHGFYTIGLGWPSLAYDTNSTANLCQDNQAPGGDYCLYNMHEQLLIGGLNEFYTPKLWPAQCPDDGPCYSPSCDGDYIACVAEECSIASLVAMAIREAGSKWASKFLSSNGGVRWNKVLFSGHSQGANMAAFASLYMTTEFGSIAGLSLFSGPKGLSEGPRANQWFFQPEDYFFNSDGRVSWGDVQMGAMASLKETSWLDGIIPKQWEAMGLGTPVVIPFEFNEDLDAVTTLEIPPKGNALVSPLDYSDPVVIDPDTVPEGDLYHCSTAMNICTPKSDPYPGLGNAENAVYAQLKPAKGAWSFVLNVGRNIHEVSSYPCSNFDGKPAKCAKKGCHYAGQECMPAPAPPATSCGAHRSKRDCRDAVCSWRKDIGQCFGGSGGGYQAVSHVNEAIAGEQSITASAFVASHSTVWLLSSAILVSLMKA